MTNEELVTIIREVSLQGEGNDTYITELWEQLSGLTHQQSYHFYVKYQNYCINAGVTPDDLIQEAFMALMATIRLYDADKGKVTTYYFTAMKSCFLRLIGADRLKPLNLCRSLDAPLDADDSGSDTFGDTLPSPEAEDELSAVIENDYSDSLKRDIDQVLKSLTPEGEKIIRCKFWHNMTFLEIERVHSIDIKDIEHEYERALRRMRSGRNRYTLSKYRDDIISRYAYRGSFASWKDTGTSSTERAAMKLIEIVMNGEGKAE